MTDYRKRYKEAHLMWAKRKLPLGFEAGHYLEPKIKDITETGFLTDYCVNMINWMEVGRVQRINVVTRASDKLVKEESGNVFTEKRYTKSIKKGAADIIGSLRGTKINIEIKNKYTNDKMRPSQIKEMNEALKAGELYWIVTCVEDFLSQLDAFLYGQ